MEKKKKKEGGRWKGIKKPGKSVRCGRITGEGEGEGLGLSYR